MLTKIHLIHNIVSIHCPISRIVVVLLVFLVFARNKRMENKLKDKRRK